jgi:hypothetical protein
MEQRECHGSYLLALEKETRIEGINMEELRRYILEFVRQGDMPDPPRDLI